MSRVKSIAGKEVEVDALEAVVEAYGKENTIKLAAIKVVKEYGDKIKKLFRERDLTSFESETYVATISTTQGEYADEQLSIDILKKLIEEGKMTKVQYNKIVKKKEYIDEAALEAALYNRKVTAEQMQGAIIQKEPVTKLVVKKKKGA